MYIPRTVLYYCVAGNFRGGAKLYYFWGPVSGTKFETHQNFKLWSTSKYEVFGSQNLKPRKLNFRALSRKSRKLCPLKITSYTVYTIAAIWVSDMFCMCVLRCTRHECGTH